DRLGNLGVIYNKYDVAISTACPALNNIVVDSVEPKDDKFIPAFYSVLQNTLVAENLQQANRIALGKTRWLVVTLNGELIDKSGTMSGGSAQVLKGAMNMNSTFSSDIKKDKPPEL
ncbi:10806_t:CDS:2, partial [Funneliformis geosporum]